ncbi:hypothetical protein ES703_116061 [subsurface metagenome]
MVIDTWYTWRFTWWDYIDALLHKYFRAKVERYIGGEWVEIATFADTESAWSESAVNRLGLYLFASSVDERRMYFDDTYVYSSEG